MKNELHAMSKQFSEFLEIQKCNKPPGSNVNARATGTSCTTGSTSEQSAVLYSDVAKRVKANQKKFTTKSVVTNGTADADSGESEDDEMLDAGGPWLKQQPRNGRRQLNRPRPNPNVRTAHKRSDKKLIIGTKVGGILQSGRVHADIFVSRVSPDAADDSIKTYLVSEGVDVIDVEKVSHPMSFTKSFKVRVKASKADEILSPDFWPEGIASRRFYAKRTVAPVGASGPTDGGNRQ